MFGERTLAQLRTGFRYRVIMMVTVYSVLGTESL